MKLRQLFSHRFWNMSGVIKCPDWYSRVLDEVFHLTNIMKWDKHIY